MRAFSYVFAATLVARLTSLVSFPVTARTLSVADMGELAIWHSVRGMLLLAAFAGLPDIVARESASRRDTRPFLDASRISFALLALIGLGLEVLLWAVPGGVALTHPHLLLLAAAVDLVPGLMLSSLAATGRYRAYAVCIVVPAVAVALATVALVLPPLSFGIVGPLWAHVGASALNTAICLALLSRLRPTAAVAATEPRLAAWPATVALLRQSLPILGVSLVGISIVTVDRYSIRGFLSAEAVGYYAVAFQAAALLSFGGGAVRTSIAQKLLHGIGQPALIERLGLAYLGCGTAFALMLAALAPEIIRLLAGPRYLPEVRLVPVLCAAFLALELYSYGQALAVARKQSKRAFHAILTAAAVALLAIPLACSVAGTQGVALALLGSYAIAAARVLDTGVLLQRRPLLILGLMAAATSLLTLHYQQPEAVALPVSRILRYLAAAACVAFGLWRLRELGRHGSP